MPYIHLVSRTSGITDGGEGKQAAHPTPQENFVRKETIFRGNGDIERRDFITAIQATSTRIRIF